jgi:hypothetical protein
VPEFGIFLYALGADLIGEWLTFYDPDAGDLERSGLIDCSPDPAKALHFADHAAALACVMQQSTRLPLRPDGRPNRPLRAFTVEIKRLP